MSEKSILKNKIVNSLLIGLAYILIYTTPIQLAFLAWILWVIFSSDYTFLSLSTNIFLADNLPWLREWIYSWFWNLWLDFWWSFPALILGFVKLAANTVIGFWILSKIRKLP